MIGTVQETQSI